MKKISLFLSFLFIFGAVSCFAQDQKKTIDIIGSWREDKTCGDELGQLIRTLKNDSVIILASCCRKHTTRCIETSYTSTDNKTLLYIAIETKSYDVARFLFNLSPNYVRYIDAYGKRNDYIRKTAYVDFIETQEDKTSKTPLMLACSNGDLTGTKLLLDYGASLLKRNYTPSGYANKSAYDYAKSAKYKDPGFMDYVQKKYREMFNEYGENQEPIYNQAEPDFLIGTPKQYTEQFI